MCFLKVANPSSDRDHERAPAAGQGNETDDQRDLIEEWLLFEPLLFSQQHQQPQQQQRRGGGGGGIVALSTQMLLPLDREREMSAMVSALTHVVAGEEQTRLDEINYSDSSAGSGSSGGVGNKREREEGGSGGQTSSESVTRLCRAFCEFPQQGTSSSVLLLPGNFFIYFIFTVIFSYLIYFYNN